MVSGVWAQALKVPMFGGFPLGSPISKVTASKLLNLRNSSKGNPFVRVRLGGVPSTAEGREETKGRFCKRAVWRMCPRSGFWY